MTALGHEVLDTTDLDRLGAALSRLRPDVVLHCAAHPAVGRAEAASERAMAVNAKRSVTV